MSTEVDAPIAPKSYVGFDTITSQIEQRLLKRGFQFNVMVVGHSGLGKTTLINTLFASHLTESSGRKSSTESIEKTAEIKVTSHTLLEEKVKLNINVIDTPGFGDQVNNDRCWEPIVKYIKEQHSQYLRKELTAQREKHIKDTRVHCVLYFIAPNGIGLKPLDIAVLKRLTEIANVVPIIAKSDSLTLEERANFKHVLQDEFKYHNFNFYPYNTDDLYEQEKNLNDNIKSIIPFAIVGSEEEISIGERAFRGRRTRWGVINVEDIQQCEFTYLRDFLTRTHLQDLIETTAVVHYETFRAKQLIALKEGSRKKDDDKK
ncbi:septin CDC10 [Ascoidea rubescens DSM 1968]|uniref:Cell division control protein 10 n=1 Tax=Ascoidea rubescens DSM 1968 TaxID=1344418 RepID=A0A1D2VM07_9ASCO|nr:cell division/GTP binding protein [Ascoidea rubescens DSM 1968]ODV62614.1 cell division/GTP binding protein [Ascoidea rubescens DSM 1968]